MLRFNLRLVSVFIAFCINATAALASNQALRFESQNFEYISDTTLDDNLVRDIIETTEATHELLELWSTTAAERKTVRLFQNEYNYIAAGGIPGSAGVHCRGSNEVVIKLNGKGSTQLHPFNRRVLIHEVTHQVLSKLLEDAPPWLIEGVAVYVESIPYHAGHFHEEKIDFRRAPHLRVYGSNHIQTVPMTQILRSDRADWNSHFATNRHGVNRQYQTAYLMTYYLIHLNSAPSPRPFAQFLEAIYQTLHSSGSSELTFRTGPYQLSLAECQALEAEMIRAYKTVDLCVEPLRGHPLKMTRKKAAHQSEAK